MKNINSKIILSSLKKYRKMMGLKQKEVAERLGLKSTNQITQWEKGCRLPTTSNLLKLAVLYRTSMDSLLIDFRRSIENQILKIEEKAGANARRPLKIIGINPSTRYIGFAIFQGTQLMDWQLKSIEGKWSKEKMERARMIVSSLIEQYQPDALAIKRLHPSRSSPNLNLLVSKIKELAERKSLRIYQYSIKELEDFFSLERINKKKLSEIIVSKYPFLSNELKKEKSHQNPYYIRMFEAVALGSICLHKLDKLCQRTTQKS